MILDCIYLRNRPDPMPASNGRIAFFNQNKVFPNGVHGVLDFPQLHKIADEAVGQLAVLDVESLPTDLRQAPDADVEAALDKLGSAVDILHERRPGLRVGYYGLLPIRDYWTPHLDESERTEKWHRADSRTRYSRDEQTGRFIAEGLADKVDVVFPSLYTFYADLPGWRDYARENIAEARRYQKQVYPYLSPYYHPAAKPVELAGTYIGDDYWEAQLELCLDEADGLVLWGAGRDWSVTDDQWLNVVEEVVG